MLKNKIFALVPILSQEPHNVRLMLGKKIGKSDGQMRRYVEGGKIPQDTAIALANVITELGVKCKVKDLAPLKSKLKSA